jgi:hypothetical protein
VPDDENRVESVSGLKLGRFFLSVDFEPREFFEEDPEERGTLRYDENGAMGFIEHRKLYDLDEDIRLMDTVGVDCRRPHKPTW